MTSSARIEAAWRRACAWDVAATKPGNVSHASAGHRMTATQFLDSADAAAPAIAHLAGVVGEGIEAAVAATWVRVGCNTNLGIVLLCVPLAAARWRLGLTPVDRTALQLALGAVLADLTPQDSAAAYRAIRQANPGGLGRADDEDVHQEPTLDLRAAMSLAAGRDRIARQYRDGFAELFSVGLGALGTAALGPWAPQGPREDAAAEAVQRVFLAWLASAPDAHIVRKHGAAVAQSVMNDAAHWLQRPISGHALDADPAWRAWDATLKQQGINPGTSADLTVATLFLDGLIERREAP
ncbi:triphosphoribosyl-dephospho-CoA synthase [Ideonella sp. 4Y11]|uniref:Triphosphoribosyl-dephospho-CoA synthase n=1 Tax=Ideonella aquatica TaxID=2824119 RepID=A0A940YI60_9BURK|nr:triphosphoribosyl-dephospho-CoA synthase [Ideonella aquatica]MBQ0960693.1 triphosphoribosyl-dephospho-CoA synthase [Ideonella aquatica]